jgi:pyruvate/2-oxoglutarate dehydrogenase complex dihydrolipoamide acyltransferase (E2) component
VLLLLLAVMPPLGCRARIACRNQNKRDDTPHAVPVPDCHASSAKALAKRWAAEGGKETAAEYTLNQVTKAAKSFIWLAAGTGSHISCVSVVFRSRFACV